MAALKDGRHVGKASLEDSTWEPNVEEAGASHTDRTWDLGVSRWTMAVLVMGAACGGSWLSVVLLLSILLSRESSEEGKWKCTRNHGIAVCMDGAWRVHGAFTLADSLHTPWEEEALSFVQRQGAKARRGGLRGPGSHS